VVIAFGAESVSCAAGWSGSSSSIALSAVRLRLTPERLATMITPNRSRGAIRMIEP